MAPARTCPSGRGRRSCGRRASRLRRRRARVSMNSAPSAVSRTKGTGAIGRELLREDHRAGPGAAAAMGRREGLVEVDVHGVDAEIARLHLADDGVEVGAVGIEIGAGFVHRLGDGDHVALEQPAGVGVGEHDRRDVRRRAARAPPPGPRCRRRAPARRPRGSRGAPPSPDWCRAPTPAPARSTACRRAPRAPP